MLAAPAASGFEPGITNVHDAVAPSESPVMLSETGTFRPRPGVLPEITDVKFALHNDRSERVWYASIENEAKGPFTEDEVLLLAEMGRVRGSTYMWRPGFSEWLPIRTGQKEHGMLEPFRQTVIQRKIYEQSLAERAAQKAGINATYIQTDGTVQTNAVTQENMNSRSLARQQNAWIRKLLIAAGFLVGGVTLGIALSAMMMHLK